MAQKRVCSPRGPVISPGSPAARRCWRRRCFGVPVFGTMAHSFIQAHDEEAVAFEHFAHSLPENVILLIDTYDTEAADEEKVVQIGA